MQPRYVPCPFPIAIDTAEGQPWSFTGLLADADKKLDKDDEYPEYAVGIVWKCLGRHPESYGDYSIPGLEREVAIERKSIEDAWGTVLGWETDQEREQQRASRRERFESELDNLSRIPAGCVIVEGDWATTLVNMPDWGEKPAEVNRKTFFRSVISFQQRFHVPWNFLPSRRYAEAFAFRWLMRYWKKLPTERRKELKGVHRDLIAQ